MPTCRNQEPSRESKDRCSTNHARCHDWDFTQPLGWIPLITHSLCGSRILWPMQSRGTNTMRTVTWYPSREMPGTPALKTSYREASRATVLDVYPSPPPHELRACPDYKSMDKLRDCTDDSQTSPPTDDDHGLATNSKVGALKEMIQNPSFGT